MSADSDKQVLARLVEELRLANKELAFQNAESKKRAAELVIANKELAYQNAEKEKRAAEHALSEAQLKNAVAVNTIALRLREVLENSQGAAYKRNLKTDKYEYMSPVFVRLTGYTPAELETMPLDSAMGLMNAEDAEEVTRVIAVAISMPPGTPFSVEYRFKHKDGMDRWLHDQFVVVADDDGQPEALVGDTSDITARKLAEASMQVNNVRYQNLTQASMDGFWAVDNNGRIQEVNDSYCRMSGYSKGAVLEMSVVDFEITENANEADFHFERIRGCGWEQFESTHRKADGSTLFLLISAVYIPEQGVILAFLSDITERKQSEEWILQLSFHDEMTGLYNRRFYEEELRRLDTARNLPLSFVIGDVNGLKLVNDSFGHVKGDELLQTVATAMKKECRADDILVRLSGDEFAVLLPKTGTVDAEHLMNRFRKRLAQEYIGLLQVSVAFGSATKEDIEIPFAAIFKTAEDAMYRSKLYESQSIQNKTISLVMTSLLENNFREQQHSQRVSDLCVELTRAMDLTEEEIAQIRLAGLMHDIGKIGLRESVLNKQGTLTDEERKEMQNHPEIGHRILSSVSDFSEISDSVLQHHERWDGTGYPNGLRGEGILLSARILAVADAYDAMTAERSYRKSRSKQEAIEVLRACSGSQFDPDVVDLFVEMLERPDNLVDKVLHH